MLLTLPALLIDASNLNLRFNPDAAECLTWKDDSETLLGDLGAFGAKSGRTVSAIFDGGAYHGEYAGEVFEAPDAGVRILFTPKGASADDAMIELASSMCADDAAAAAFSAGDACDYLETERGLVQLTLKNCGCNVFEENPDMQPLFQAAKDALRSSATEYKMRGKKEQEYGLFRAIIKYLEAKEDGGAPAAARTLHDDIAYVEDRMQVHEALVEGHKRAVSVVSGVQKATEKAAAAAAELAATIQAAARELNGSAHDIATAVVRVCE